MEDKLAFLETDNSIANFIWEKDFCQGGNLVL